MIIFLQAKEPLTICAELKFAEQKHKSFKSYLFEISEGKLICYKDKSVSYLIVYVFLVFYYNVVFYRAHHHYMSGLLKI